MKKQTKFKLLTIALSLAFLTGCLTVPVPAVTVENQVDPVIIAIPSPPEIPDLEFLSSNGGVWLSADDGRMLALYIVNMRAYQETLERVLKYEQD